MCLSILKNYNFTAEDLKKHRTTEELEYVWLKEEIWRLESLYIYSYKHIHKTRLNGVRCLNQAFSPKLKERLESEGFSVKTTSTTEEDKDLITITTIVSWE